MQIARPILSHHSMTRLHAWAQLMLAWVGMMLFSDFPQLNHRRFRQRHRLLNLRRMARLVARMIFLRAAQIARPSSLPRVIRRDFTPSGFRRRGHARQLVRSVIGSALRRKLRHRDARTRFAILVDALQNYETYTTRMLRRLQRGLTRLRPIVMSSPQTDTVRSAAALQAPCAADTS